MKSFAILGALALIAGASAQVQAPVLGRNLATSNLVFSLLAQGDDSSADKAGVVDCLNQRALDDYWRRYHGSAPRPPAVDWTRNRVVAVHLGQRPTSGYSLTITALTRGIGVANVVAAEREPLSGQYVTQRITSPWVLLQVERTATRFALSLTKAPADFAFGPNGGTVLRGAGSTAYIPNDPFYAIPNDPGCWSDYYAGDYCGLSVPGVLTIESEPALEAFLRAGGDRGWSGLGKIDWTREHLVAVGAGMRPMGYGIQVKGVKRQGNAATVYISDVQRPGRAATRLRANQPYALIKVDRSITQFRVRR